MSLIWKGTATCGTYIGGHCDASCEVTFELEGVRKITVKAPKGWVIYARSLADSREDVSKVDVDGGDYEVRCPEHAKDPY
jgi:hypothetical protein